MSTARDVAERLRKRRTVTKIRTDEGSLYVRGLSGAERKAWLESFKDGGKRDGMFVDHVLVAMALCDESGAPLFEEPAEPEQPSALDQALDVVCDWDAAEVRKVVREVMKLSGMEKRAVDDSEKKSEASPSSSGGTGSHEN